MDNFLNHINQYRNGKQSSTSMFPSEYGASVLYGSSHNTLYKCCFVIIIPRVIQVKQNAARGRVQEMKVEKSDAAIYIYVHVVHVNKIKFFLCTIETGRVCRKFQLKMI